MSDPTLKDDLAAAIQTVEKAPPAAPPPTPAVKAAPEPAAPAPKAAPEPSRPAPEGRDDKGRFIPKAAPEGAPKAPEGAPTPPAAPPDQAATPPAPKEPAAPPASPIKPPQSWKADAREEWEKVPPRAREEIIRREREVQQALQESSESRRIAQAYREATAPFEGMIRAEGGEPIQAIRGLLQTAAALRTAPMQTKAQMIARMVQAYLPGRDGLVLLDQALAGAAPQPGMAPQPSPQEFRDPRLDPVLEEIQQAREAQRQAAMAKAQAEIAEVQEEEFFMDVRDLMADIIQAHRSRGMDISIRDAYNRAIRSDPTTSRILEQRAQATQSHGVTPEKLAAAGSLRSTPVTPPGGGSDDLEIRALLEKQMGLR